jgi:molybdopterin-guanine dinucleotide biosynthesis protein A
VVKKLSVLLLAGGRSRRMGQDKVWLALDGVSLVERVVRRVLPVAGEILFSASAPEPFAALVSALREQGVPARVVTDRFPGAGPLAGIHAGLTAARHDLLLALAADIPFVNLALIEQMIGLASGFDAVVPHVPHPTTGELTWEPLHALYRRSCLPAIETRLAAGERQVLCFYPDIRTRSVTVEEIACCDPDGLSFLNVNTPEDWQRAQRLIAERGTS